MTTHTRITLPDEPGISSGNGMGALTLDASTRIEVGANEIHKLRALAVQANLLADRLGHSPECVDGRICGEPYNCPPGVVGGTKLDGREIAKALRKSERMGQVR